MFQLFAGVMVPDDQVAVAEEALAGRAVVGRLVCAPTVIDPPRKPSAVKSPGSDARRRTADQPMEQSRFS